ncbi:MAG: glucose-1-phosphate adenylyltransferase family protein [bacterium]
MNRTLGMLLAGGVGSRLGALASIRAKPAVPFGGIYRIIDFTLSNSANSGINWLGVLTQYKPLALMQHIGDGKAWGVIGRTRGVKILPPRTGEKDSDWYKGTADAVRQNMDFINQHEYCDTVLILSGDHIYYMDYSKMVDFHRARKADLTIATMEVPLEDAHHFGIARVDADSRIIEWEEKPKQPRSNLASMGIYAFSTIFLQRAFTEVDGNDFGKHIVPYACKVAATYAYPFSGYWRDVGTIKSFWRTNLDLLCPKAGLAPEKWRIYTNANDEQRLGDRPPTYIGRRAIVKNSIISHGCTIEGEVINSVLSPGVWVQKGAVVQNAVLMGACEIGAGASVDRAVMDKNAMIGDKAVVGYGDDFTPNKKYPHTLEEGLTLIGKGAAIPAHCVIGRHCIVSPYTSFSHFPSAKVESGMTV